MCMSGNAVYLESSCKLFHIVVMDCNSCKTTHIDNRLFFFIKLIVLTGTEHHISAEQKLGRPAQILKFCVTSDQ